MYNSGIKSFGALFPIIYKPSLKYDRYIVWWRKIFNQA